MVSQITGLNIFIEMLSEGSAEPSVNGFITTPIRFTPTGIVAVLILSIV